MSAPGSKPPGFMQVVGAVFWSFLGVRKRSAHEADAVRLNPVHVIIAGTIGAALFVLVILFVVHLVISSATH